MICKKVKYSSEKFALDNIAIIKKNSIRKVIPDRAYLCHCGCWHLTSSVDKNNLELVKLNEYFIKEKRILTDRITELENQKKTTNLIIDKSNKLEVKKTELYKQQQDTINSLQRKIRELRKTNIELITKLLNYLKPNKPTLDENNPTI